MAPLRILLPEGEIRRRGVASGGDSVQVKHGDVQVKEVKQGKLHLALENGARWLELTDLKRRALER